MTWEDILNEAKEYISGGQEKVATIMGWVGKAEQAYNNGTILVTDILAMAKYFNEMFETLKTVDFKQLLDSVGKGNGENAYSNIVATLTTDQLLALHASSVEQLRVASDKKLRELEVIRSALELPVKLRAIIGIFL